MPIYKVIIAGSRSFVDNKDNYRLLCQVCDKMLAQKHPDIEIVSGGAPGADEMGEIYARQRYYDIKRILPDWEQFKKAAGPIRNYEMAAYSDALIAFWDGESRGTKSMIDAATEHGLKIKIVKV